jgi:hypothetical protein
MRLLFGSANQKKKKTESNRKIKINKKNNKPMIRSELVHKLRLPLLIEQHVVLQLEPFFYKFIVGWKCFFWM